MHGTCVTLSLIHALSYIEARSSLRLPNEMLPRRPACWCAHLTAELLKTKTSFVLNFKIIKATGRSPSAGAQRLPRYVSSSLVYKTDAGASTTPSEKEWRDVTQTKYVSSGRLRGLSDEPQLTLHADNGSCHKRTFRDPFLSHTRMALRSYCCYPGPRSTQS